MYYVGFNRVLLEFNHCKTFVLKNRTVAICYSLDLFDKLDLVFKIFFYFHLIIYRALIQFYKRPLIHRHKTKLNKITNEWKESREKKNLI